MYVFSDVEWRKSIEEEEEKEVEICDINDLISVIFFVEMEVRRSFRGGGDYLCGGCKWN